MRKWIVAGLLALGLVLIFYLVKHRPANEFSLQFQGANEGIELSGGRWTCREGKESFTGGRLTYKRPLRSDLLGQRDEFFYLDQGEEKAILVQERVDESGGPLALQEDLGGWSKDSVQGEPPRMDQPLYYRLTLRFASGLVEQEVLELHLEKGN